MKRILPVFLLFLSLFSLNSNAQTFIWAEQISGSSVQLPRDVIVDASGSNYSVGWTVGNTTFGSNALSGNSYDGYLVKYDINGDYQWSRSITGALYQSAFEVERDGDDGVYVAGWFYGSITIGDTSISGTTNDYDAYLVKFDTNGNFKWVRTQSGAGITKPIGMAVDDDGDVYVQIGFLGNFTAGSTALAATSTTGWNNAMVKYDSAGTFQWKTLIEGYHYISSSWYWDYGGGVAIDGSGNPYCVGTFHSNDTLEIGSLSLVPVGWDGYVAKFNQSTGAGVWVRRAGGTSTDYATGIAIDNSDKIFISGYNYSTNMTLGSYSKTYSGPYWGRYNTSGTSQEISGGTGLTYANSVQVDNEGNLYMTGLMYQNINLTFGSLSVTNSSGASYTPYYYKFDHSGNSQKYLTKPTASGGINYATHIYAASEDIVIATGGFATSIGLGSTNMTSGGSYDGFVTRIANCEKLVAVASTIGGDSVCSGETTTLSADTNSLYDYQWLYNGAVISGEINSTYSTGTAGNYAVIVDSIGCVDTSNVIAITVNSLPTVTHSNLATVCDGDDPFTLTGGSPSGGVYSGTGVVGGTSFDPGAAATGNNILTYLYTDANGCADSVDKTITVQTSPAIFTTTISACESDSPISLATSAYGFPTGGTHSGTGVSGTTFNPATATAGTHIIYYSSSNGCVSPDSITATVSASPNVSLDTFPDKCVTASGFALSGGTPSGGSYSGLGVFGTFYYPAFAGAGTHNIVYSVTSSGCTSTDTSTITVDPVATSSVSTFPDLCADDDTLLLNELWNAIWWCVFGNGCFVQYF